MPRISFDYPAVGAWSESTGNGSSTWDVCKKCFQIDPAQLISKLGGPYNGEPSPSTSEPLFCHDIGEGNPSLYEGETVFCECCDKRLTLSNY